MKNVAQLPRLEDSIRELISPSLTLLALALPAALCVGVAISRFNIVYGLAAAGALIVVIILQLRRDELFVMLIIAVHVIVDWYLALRLVSLLMSLVLLFVCYFWRSADRPWIKPRALWLWVLFLTLTIYPAIKGGRFDLYDADTYYPSLVLSAFIMFWLGNIIAKDISAVRRVFQFLTILAVLIAIHTIIEETMGKFLFESARAEAALAQNSNYQLVQNLGVQISRAGSFFGHPNGNGTFLAISFFLSLGLCIESKQLWTKMIYLLEMPLILFALMYTYSTGAWLALLAGIVGFIFLAGCKRDSVLLLISIVALAAIVVIVFPSQLALQLSHANANNESSLHLGGWQTAMNVITAYPLFGIGLGGQAYMLGSLPYIVPAQVVPLLEPDNSYLEWGAMAGVPVMLVFLLLLGCVFWFSWHTWSTMDRRYRPILGSGIAVLIALSVSSFSVDGWTDPAGLASLGWLIAGLITSPLIGRYLRQRLVPLVDKAPKIIHIQEA